MELFLTPVLAAISLGFLAAIAKAALGLGFVIFVHELGHFLVAKACGVKCEKFYVGFDVPIKIGPIQLPRTLFRKQWGETEYGIGIVPLGGYVKMLGQDDNPANSAKEAERIRVAREAGDTEAAESAIDPRSYPAKTVGQRLSIISAGVIMNLIFAVIFSMVAYKMGVTYPPTVVGATTPGLSAWQVGLETGDRVLQLGKDGPVSEHLRFDKDMMVKVMMTGANEKLDLLVQRYTPPGTEPAPPQTVTVTLSSPQEELHGRPIIGIGPYGVNVIRSSAEAQEMLAHLPTFRAQPPLEDGDRIVAVNGTQVADYRQLQETLAAHVDEPWELGIERAPVADGDQAAATDQPAEQLTVSVDVFPVRHLGIHLTAGPVIAIQQGSVAAQAGIEVGDELIKINDEPIGDPLRVADRFRRLIGQDVQIEVKRGDATRIVSLTPTRPSTISSHVGSNRPISIDSVGLAFRVINTVAGLDPNGPAANSNLQPGDVIHAAEFVAKSEEDAATESTIFGPPRPIELGNVADWPRVHDRIRLSLPGTSVKLTYERDGKAKTVEVTPQLATDWNYADRHLMLGTSEEIHQVESWGTAFSLGWRETVESMKQVYFILYRLITRQLSPMNLGGPASIATMAGMEASESTARLLMFLTLLSANLAVVNFLPIPVLDGGHAVFLLYEGIFRKPMPERVAFGLTMVGFCFVLGLMLFVIGLDIWRFTGMGS